MQPVQGTLDDLGTPLAGVTFVVVDLETTGGSPATCGITEIGAVKVRGGEVLGEFQTLVNPGEPIPAFISVLTGISNAMVAQAPRIGAVLPSFLEFARGSVLVAHNAGFDITFLKTACAATGHTWPGNPVVDTVQLARQLVHRDEARDRRLGTLAGLFGATTTPDHRALHDARATVDVLHALLERVGNQGVRTLEELRSYTSRVSPEQRRKRFLADPLPAAPGVYVFKDDRGRPLYVGTSQDIRARVRTYFTASEQRTRMSEMVAAATHVQPIVCQSTLEAQIRELRLIAEHKPRYNRRSTRPERVLWLKLTDEAFPRLSIVRQVRDDAGQYVGPFTSRSTAESAMAAIHEVVPLRQCTTKLSLRGSGSACMLAEMGRCGAPCVGAQSPADYAAATRVVPGFFTGDARGLVGLVDARMASLAVDERFEEAALARDRLTALVRAAARAQRIEPLARAREIVAAQRVALGGWELVCIRYGRLAGVSVSPRGADPRPYVETLRATAEAVAAPVAPAPAATVGESELLLRWLESAGVRLVELDGEWSCPASGAGAIASTLKRTHDLARRGFDRDALAGVPGPSRPRRSSDSMTAAV